jgi:predicted CXXCH cytochrome family protein
MRCGRAMSILATVSLALALNAAPQPTLSACLLPWVARSRATVAKCLACHDGGGGPAVSLQYRAHGTGSSHPVGVRYADSAGRTRLHPTPRSPRIVLAGGEVGCTSCHDNVGYGPARLAAPPDQLCGSCHDR